jgi:hypothetical protein
LTGVLLFSFSLSWGTGFCLAFGSHDEVGQRHTPAWEPLMQRVTDGLALGAMFFMVTGFAVVQYMP